MKHAIFALALPLLLVACASEPEGPVHHYHPATVTNDLFQVEQGMPVREVKKDPSFFSRRCEKSSRPFFTKVEYSCSEIR